MESDDIAVANNFGIRQALEHVRGGVSTQTSVFLGVYRANARMIVPEGKCIAFSGLGEHGRLFLSLSTRFEDMDGFRVPRELRYVVISRARRMEEALDYLYDQAHIFARVLQLVVNAGADILQETFVQALQDGFLASHYRQTEFNVPRLPWNGRTADETVASNVLNAAFGLPKDELPRWLRAVDHYCTALSHWREGETPLVIVYLFIGIETLCEAISRNLQRRGNITEADLFTRYGVEGAKYPKTELLQKIRLLEVFGGNAEIAHAARKASDGIEHGFASNEETWNLSRKAFKQTAKYLRRALFNMLALDEEVMQTLYGPRFDDVLVEQPQCSKSGIYYGDPIEQLKVLDFRIVEAVPFIRNMRVNDSLGTYEFTFDWPSKS